MKSEGGSSRVVVGIPARMRSSRFPGKPLCPLLGMPMIEHVYRRCLLSDRVDRVFVATCDEEIYQVVEGFGGTAMMTEPDILRPALRVAEAVEQMQDVKDGDIVVVVQGDEPLVRPEMIEWAIEPLLEDEEILCVNMASDLTEVQLSDPNEIKIVADLNMNALYMSRMPIPSHVHPEGQAKSSKHGIVLRQVCIFPFRKRSLIAFSNLPSTPLEQAESIEMLRAIEHGYKVRLVFSPFLTRSVDTEQDRQIVECLLRSDELCASYMQNEAVFQSLPV